VTALKGYIDVLRRGAARETATLDSSLGAMANEAERMRRLVLDLLTLARIDAHRALEPQVLDVNEELAEVLDEGVPGMPETVERRFAPAPLQVHADRNAVHTIARNLLVNACKYAAGAPQRWSTSVDGDRVRIDVHDDGPGIAGMDLAHVFERFYRGEKTRAREEGGSGLGLSIVEGLARSMGGDAAVWSAEGNGTTVSVWLPRAASA
jgi:two-component system OmpR family sensor kinase